MPVDAGTVRAFLASLPERSPGPPPRDRSRAMLESLQRPDLRYLVATILGARAVKVARVARAILEAAGAPTGLLGERTLVAGAPLDEPLLAKAGTLAAAAGYQLAAAHPELGEPTRRDMTVLLGLVAFAEANQRVALLLDPAIDPDDPVHAPLPDVVVIGPVDEEQAARALALVPDGRPAVSAPQQAASRAASERIAAERGIPLLLGGRDYEALREGDALTVRVGDERYAGLPLPAGFGEDDLATGVAAALALGVLGIRMREEWVIEGCRSIGA